MRRGAGRTPDTIWGNKVGRRELLRCEVVTMVQPTKARARQNRRVRTRLRRSASAARCIFVESEMRSVLVVVRHIFAEQPPEMTLAQDDEVVQQFPADAADPALGDAVLPRATVCGLRWLDAERPHRRDYLCGEDRNRDRRSNVAASPRVRTSREAAGRLAHP